MRQCYSVEVLTEIEEALCRTHEASRTTAEPALHYKPTTTAPRHALVSINCVCTCMPCPQKNTKPAVPATPFCVRACTTH